MPGVKTEDQVTYDTKNGDHERLSHIIRRTEKDKALGISANALVTEAMVLGKTVRALCGKEWIPSRDPKKYPLCPECGDVAAKLMKRKR